jgi:hypothetical protein
VKIFLGGTTNNSTWREILIPMLEKKNIDYFNPVVEDWTEECFQIEELEKEKCDICLYTITPYMTGTYSIAEIVDDSNKRPEKAILIILQSDGKKEFDIGQLKSLIKVKKIIDDNGAKSYLSLESFINSLN